MEKFILALIVCFATTVSFADSPKPLSQEEQQLADAEAKAVAARKAVEEKKAMEAARRKAEWSSKTFTEAMAIRGQSCVDASQYVGGKVMQGVANADGYIGAAITYPAAYVTAGAFSLAEGSKNYANNAWNNETKTEVALKVGDKEVKTEINVPKTK